MTNFWRGLGWAAYAAGRMTSPHLHPGCIDAQRRECIERQGPKMRVFVIRNSDGAEVEDVPTWVPHYTADEGDVYWWTEGNMACDCNRFLQFERGQGRDPCDDEVACGHGLYSVRLEREDGTVIE